MSVQIVLDTCPLPVCLEHDSCVALMVKGPDGVAYSTHLLDDEDSDLESLGELITTAVQTVWKAMTDTPSRDV